MKSSRPKQYLLLHGKPILQHTLEKLALSNLAGLVVCLAENDPYWDSVQLSRPVIRVQGGSERCHSVFNGLQALQHYAQPGDWVLVHDAARPCVRPSDIEKLMTQLADHPVGGLLAMPVRDTLKRADSQRVVVETVNREGLWHALTPQMFRLAALSQALEKVLSSNQLVTDEAQAMERMGYCPVLVEGHGDNIKVTHPQDLDLAALYLQRNCWTGGFSR
jgi:2-C-methyl-D-erythritol 4-phosphate cytidylyltransferase